MGFYPFKVGIAILAPMAIVAPVAYSSDYLTIIEAQKLLFPTADQFIKREMLLSDSQLSQIKDLAGVRQRNATPIVVIAKRKQEVLGRFFVDEVVGKHEFITYAAAIDPKGLVLGVEIMSYRETHGGEIRRENWRAHFRGKKLTDAFKLDRDVPNITGATLSCRNVLDGVKRLLALHKVVGIE